MSVKKSLAALVAAIVLLVGGGTATAEGAFVWDVGHYGRSPFASEPLEVSGGKLTPRGVDQYKNMMVGALGDEAFDALGIPEEYRQVARTAVAECESIPVVRVSDPNAFEREAYRQYPDAFVQYGAYKVAVVQGVVPPGQHGARHDSMLFRRRGVPVVVHNVIQTFAGHTTAVIIVDPSTMKGLRLGVKQRCCNFEKTTVTVFVEEKVVTREKIIEKPVPVIKYRDRVVEKEVKVPYPVVKYRDRIVERVERERELVPVFIPPALAQTPNGYFPTEQRWTRQTPGWASIATDVIGLGLGAIHRGTTFNVRGGKATATGGSAYSKSSVGNITNTNQNQNMNNNANSNNVGVGVNAGNKGK